MMVGRFQLCSLRVCQSLTIRAFPSNLDKMRKDLLLDVIAIAVILYGLLSILLGVRGIHA